MKFFEKARESQKNIASTMVFFEAPHRLLTTLEELQQVFGDIHLVVCREMTKTFQEVRREKISKSLEHFKTTPPRGEFVLLLNTNLDE